MTRERFTFNFPGGGSPKPYYRKKIRLIKGIAYVFAIPKELEKLTVGSWEILLISSDESYCNVSIHVFMMT